MFNLRRADSAVIDTHPDTTHTLRIDAAFPALEEYASSLELNGLDSMEYSHVPYVVLLVKALGVWRSSVSCGTVLSMRMADLPQHDGALPSNSSDREAFKALLKSWRRNGEEENFDEALAQAYRAWSASDVRSASSPISLTMQVPSDIQQLFEDDKCKAVSKDVRFESVLWYTRLTRKV